MNSSVGKEVIQTENESTKTTVDKVQKDSIMNISTEAIVLKRFTNESENIMTKTIKAADAINATASATKSLPAKSTAPTVPAPAASAPAAAATAPVVTAATIAPTKADKGREIFNSYLVDGKLTAERKVVIKALQTGAGLTEKGAATYYQNMKKKAGLVNAAAAPASTEKA